MDDIESKLGQILSDPDAMLSILSMVKAMGTPNGSTNASAPDRPLDVVDPAKIGHSSNCNPTGNSPVSLIETLGSTGNQNQAELLDALRPFLNANKQETLDRALRLARLWKTVSLTRKSLEQK